MSRRTPTTERLGAFSDGVFAVIITIMVLGLKPPEEPTFVVAMLVSLKFPLWGFGLIRCVLLLYLRPEPPEIGREVARKVPLSDAVSPHQEDIR